MPKKNSSKEKDSLASIPLDEFEFNLTNVNVVQDIEEEEDDDVTSDAVSDKLTAATGVPDVPEKKEKIVKQRTKKKKDDLDLEPDAPEKTTSRARALISGNVGTALIKEHGALALSIASELAEKRPPSIPFGVFSLDLALGGGMPWGHVLMLFGPEHSGKTTLGLKLLAKAQNTCVACYHPLREGTCKCGQMKMAVCAIVDVEGTLNYDWANWLGIDLTELLISKPSTGEETIEIVEALLRSGEVDFILLDSLAFMTPTATIENEAGASDMGKQAQLLAKGARKFRAAMAERAKVDHLPTLVATNHIYFNVGQMFGNPEQVAGGKKWRFLTTLEVRVQGKVTEDKDNGEVLHSTVSFTVQKNKWAPNARKGEFVLLLKNSNLGQIGDTADAPYIRQQADYYGLLKKGEGNKYWLLGQGYPTYKELEAALHSDDPYREKVIAALMVESSKAHTFTKKIKAA